jgi:predicted SprT family Zn-dependent metalloprotease
MALLSSLAQQAERKFKSLPQEEQNRITAERKEQEIIKGEQKRVTAYMNQGKCPDCLGKLIRGKKDKKNDYKRAWRCEKCNKDIIH